MQYSGGTVAVTYNSNVVWKNGTGVSWAGIKRGSLFGVQGDAVFYPVGQYRPATGGGRDSIVLTGTYRGGTNAAAAYVISNDFTPNLGLPMINRGDLETATIYDYAMAQIDSVWKSVPGDMFKSVYDPTNRGYVDHAVQADTVAWAGITGTPTTFTPAHHANTHLPGTADPIPLANPSVGGLCPPVDNVSIVITAGKLTATPQPPSAHAATHRVNGSDSIGLASTTIEGLCPMLDGVTVSISGGKLIANKQAPPTHSPTHLSGGTDPIALASAAAAGLCPAVDGVTIQVTGGKLATMPVPPQNHAPRHLIGGADPMALASTTAAGLCPQVDGVSIVISNNVLTAQGQVPLPHGSTHHTNSSDPIGLASTTTDGLCPPVDGTTIQIQSGKLVSTVQGGGQITTFTSFTVPAQNSNVAVTLASATNIVAGAGYTLTDGTNFMNASCVSIAGSVVTFRNIGGGATSGTLNNGVVFNGNTAVPAGGMEVGTLFAYASTMPPAGCLLCDGVAYGRNVYPDLWNVCGTTYGAGDGSTTFNVPDLRARFVLGQGTGTAGAPALGAGLTNRAIAAKGGEETHLLLIAELAAHSHSATQGTHTHTDAGHVHYCAGVDHLHALGGHVHGMDHYHNWAVQGSHSHTLGGHTHTYVNAAGATGSQPGSGQYSASGAANSGGPSGGSDAANTPAGNTAYASATSAGWANTAGPNTSSSAADRSLAFNSNSAAAAISTVSAGAITIGTGGSDTAHNNMPPFVALCYMIKASKTGGPTAQAPIADTTQPGLMNKLSGLQTDFVGGDNACHDLGSAVRLAAPIVRSYNSIGNPNFEVDARTIGAGTAASGQFAIDRWLYGHVGTNAGTWDQIAVPGGVMIAGTNFCVSSSALRYTLTTQEATLAAADYIYINHFIEGPRLRELLGGQTAISIVCRSSVANTVFGLSLRDASSAYSLTKLCTIATANTWTLIPLPNIPTWTASGNFPMTPGVVGYMLGITLAAGTSYKATANDVWATGNFLGAAGQGNFAANPINSTFDLGFVQHEPGSTPNGIIDLDFPTNLDQCARYFSKSYNYEQAIGASTPDNGVGASGTASSVYVPGPFRFTKPMAKAPNVSIYSRAGVANQVSFIMGNGNKAVSSIAAVSETGVGWLVLAAANNATPDWCIFHYAADAGW